MFIYFIFVSPFIYFSFVVVVVVLFFVLFRGGGGGGGGRLYEQ